MFNFVKRLFKRDRKKGRPGPTAADKARVQKNFLKNAVKEYEKKAWAKVRCNTRATPGAFGKPRFLRTFANLKLVKKTQYLPFATPYDAKFQKVSDVRKKKREDNLEKGVERANRRKIAHYTAHEKRLTKARDKRERYLAFSGNSSD